MQNLFERGPIKPFCLSASYSPLTVILRKDMCSTVQGNTSASVCFLVLLLPFQPWFLRTLLLLWLCSFFCLVVCVCLSGDEQSEIRGGRYQLV